MQDLTTFYPNGSVEHADGTFLELAQDPKTNMVITVTPTQYKLKIMKSMPTLPWLGQDQEAWETILEVQQPTLEALLGTLTQMVSRNQFARVNNDLIFRVDASESG